MLLKTQLNKCHYTHTCWVFMFYGDITYIDIRIFVQHKLYISPNPKHL